jgi:sigma-B regulation protein RsbU (phosphoserine phosphatase)
VVALRAEDTGRTGDVEFVDLIVDLIKAMAVVIVVAYLLTRTRLYRQVIERRFTWTGRTVLILLLGVFSIWGTLAGVEVLGGIANTRDLGPALGGLLGGPIVGLGAGVIGAVQRLTMGGFTAVPCALATVVAGLSGGVVFLIFKRRLPPIWAAVLLAVFTESFHMGLTLLMARPFDEALRLVGEVIIPMILVNAAGMGLFVFIVRNEEQERVTAAQKERMAGELAVARDIQLGIVPSIFPPFPHRRDVDVHASLESAREVGGDLYDFQFVDEDRLYVALGDVSGKGVPASLFMAVTITLLRAVSQRTVAPDEVLARLNAALCRNNESSMFVTLFFAVYDVRTGELRYSTGGHPPPYVVGPGGEVTALSQVAGAGLGVCEGIEFGVGELTLRPDEALLLYSDGVTEAMDAAGALFGERRLEEALRAGALDAGGLTEAVRAAVQRFTGGAEQSDDLTLLAVRRPTDSDPSA